MEYVMWGELVVGVGKSAVVGLGKSLDLRQVFV